jgi:hypothetical protein
MADTSVFTRLRRLFSTDVIIRNPGGGELKDLIYVISSYFIFSNAFAASSSNGSTLAKSFSHDSLKALASYFYIPVNLSSS